MERGIRIQLWIVGRRGRDFFFVNAPLSMTDDCSVTMAEVSDVHGATTEMSAVVTGGEEDQPGTAATASQQPSSSPCIGRKWYCTMAVKGGYVRNQSSSALTAAHDSASPSSSSSSIVSPSNALNPRRKINKRCRLVARRTKLYYSTDPLSDIKELGGSPATATVPSTTGGCQATRESNDRSPWKVVAIIGPLEKESHAVLVNTIWNHKSRGPMPRAIWGLLIAEHFHLKIWISIADLFMLEGLQIRQEPGGKVFLTLPKNLASFVNAAT